MKQEHEENEREMHFEAESAAEHGQPAGPGEPQADELTQLREQLEAKEQEVQALRDKHLRTYAEFENYKKRAARDHEASTKYGNEQLLKEVLPVVDNLERAIAHTRDSNDPDKIIEGLELILKQCRETIAKFGVKPIESHLMPFDPSRHEAMGQMESAEHEPGTVIQEIQKGYQLNDRVLRPALVIVSKKKEQQEAGESESA